MPVSQIICFAKDASLTLLHTYNYGSKRKWGGCVDIPNNEVGIFRDICQGMVDSGVRSLTRAEILTPFNCYECGEDYVKEGHRCSLESKLLRWFYYPICHWYSRYRNRRNYFNRQGKFPSW